MELGEDLFNGDLKKVSKEDTSDDFGRPAHKWEYKNDEIVTAADSADETYVVDDTKLTMGSILTDDDYFDYSEEDANVDNADYVLNGGEDDDKDTKLQKGDIVEVFEGKGGKVEKVVAIRYTAAKIDEVSTDLSNSEEKAGASYSIELVEVNSDSNPVGAGTYYDDYDKDSEILNGFSANTYKEGTVLAVALKGDDTILGSYVADVVTGTVSSYKANDYVTVDGTKYTMADEVDGIKDEFSFDDEYNLYLTSDGYVIAVDGAAEASIDDVYYVTGVYKTSSNMGTDRYYAQTVALDGTVSEIELEKSEFEESGIFENKLSVTPGEDLNKFVSTGVAGLYTLTDDSESNDDKGGNDKYNVEGFNSNKNYTVYAKGELASSVAKDDTNMTVGTKKVYMNKDTNYIAVESQGDDLDVSTAVGGMKCAKDGATAIVISNKDDEKAAVYVLFVGEKLSASVASDEIVYLAETSDQVNADGRVNTLWFMEDNSSEEVTINKNDNTVGFWTYDIDEDDVYDLMSAADSAIDSKVDDDTNGYATLTINKSSIYSTRNLLTVGSYFEDVAFGSAKVIDTRSDIESDKVYDKEITSVSNLKNAAEKGNITIDVYVTDGEITFIAVTGVSASANTPSITTEPVAIEMVKGEASKNLTVEASGNGTLSYQWYQDNVKVGTNSATLDVSSLNLDAGTYSFKVEVTNTKDGFASTAVSSKAVTVTVKPVKPATTGATATQSTGYDVDLELTAGYVKDAAYKLYKGGVEIEGLTLDTKTENHVKFTGKADNFETGSDYTLEITVNGQTNTSDAFTINAHA